VVGGGCKLLLNSKVCIPIHRYTLALDFERLTTAVCGTELRQAKRDVCLSDRTYATQAPFPHGERLAGSTNLILSSLSSPACCPRSGNLFL
jgi:hypothetical protein